MGKTSAGAVHYGIAESAAGYSVVSHECDVMEQIAGLVMHRAALDRTIGEAVAHARGDHGVSWAQIGRLVGMSKQGAQKRYGRAGDA